MKKNQSQYRHPVYKAIIAAMTLVYVISLFILAMTYKKQATVVANDSYVSEVTKWPGHTHIVHIPIEYELNTTKV